MHSALNDITYGLVYRFLKFRDFSLSLSSLRYSVIIFIFKRNIVRGKRDAEKFLVSVKVNIFKNYSINAPSESIKSHNSTAAIQTLFSEVKQPEKVEK